MREKRDDLPENLSRHLAVLETCFQSWSPEQRTAFAAALAERWLPVYASSAAADGQGAALLRQALAAVWKHIRGQRLTAADRKRLHQQVLATAPAEEEPRFRQAAAVCRIVALAMQCCGSGSNRATAKEAALAACEAAQALGGVSAEPRPTTSSCAKPADREDVVEAETVRQFELAGEISGLHVFDDAAVESLRRGGTTVPGLLVGPSPGASIQRIPLPPFLAAAIERQDHDADTDELEDEHAAKPTAEFAGFPAGAADELRTFVSALTSQAGGSSPAADPLSDALRRFASVLDSPGGLQSLLSVAGAASGQRASSGKEHQRLLRVTLAPWSPAQRTAFVAALAERWLPAYEGSAEDPAQLRRILEAVWDHLRGRPIAPRDRKRYSKQITAGVDGDLDADEAAACEILDRALECCGDPGNLEIAEAAALAACEAAEAMAECQPARRCGGHSSPPGAIDEEAAQVALLKKIAPLTRFDDETVRALRGSLSTS